MVFWSLVKSWNLIEFKQDFDKGLKIKIKSWFVKQLIDLFFVITQMMNQILLNWQISILNI